MNSRNQGDTEEKILPVAPTAHMLGRLALVHPDQPVMNHSSGKHLHTSASLIKNTKKPVLHESFTIINHKQGENIAYGHGTQIQLSLALHSSHCLTVSLVFLPSRWYHCDLLYQIQLSLSSPPTSKNA